MSRKPKAMVPKNSCDLNLELKKSLTKPKIAQLKFEGLKLKKLSNQNLAIFGPVVHFLKLVKTAPTNYLSTLVHKIAWVQIELVKLSQEKI